METNNDVHKYIMLVFINRWNALSLAGCIFDMEFLQKYSSILFATRVIDIDQRIYE